jgi:3-oxoacyl-ACP reductase-like protein
VVQPFSKSLKVVAFMEEAIIFSEKVAVISAAGATPVAFAVGRVLMTLGAAVIVVLGGEAYRGCQSGP